MTELGDISWARVLVVDDEAAVRFTLRAILEDEGANVVEATDGQDALSKLEQGDIDLVIADLKMPRMNGMELLKRLPECPGHARAIMVTAHGSERHAVEAMRHGALDYFAKPFDPAEIVRVARASLERVHLQAENARLRSRQALSSTMLFRSEPMERVARLVERVADRDVTVLITGESGTGKELVARAIVNASRRADKPFVTFNCAALPRDLAEAELFGHSKGAFTGATGARRGLFREADGGTLLLDEIGELDKGIQGSLLRVIQEREVRPVGVDRPEHVDIRLLATTHRNLAEEAEQDRFRHDLYYRLSVVEIALPPLRSRPGDISLLARTFARRAADRFGVEDVELSDRTISALEAAPWPGNVRQLQHVVERMVALSDGRLVDEDPFGDQDPAVSAKTQMSLPEQVARFERQVIARKLEDCGRNQSETARQLGISRTTLIDKLNRYGLK